MALVFVLSNIVFDTGPETALVAGLVSGCKAAIACVAVAAAASGSSAAPGLPSSCPPSLVAPGFLLFSEKDVCFVREPFFFVPHCFVCLEVQGIRHYLPHLLQMLFFILSVFGRCMYVHFSWLHSFLFSES